VVTRVVAGHLRNKVIVTRLLKREMHMSRSPRMSMQQFQQFSYWAIMWNRIRYGLNSLKPKRALIVTFKHRTAIEAFPSCILYVIETFAVRLPYINVHSLYGHASCIFDGTENQARLTIRIVGEEVAVGKGWRSMDVEGAQEGSVSGIRRLWMIDRVDNKG
jgi:hypothetical protein